MHQMLLSFRGISGRLGCTNGQKPEQLVREIKPDKRPENGSLSAEEVERNRKIPSGIIIVEN